MINKKAGMFGTLAEAIAAPWTKTKRLRAAVEFNNRRLIRAANKAKKEIAADAALGLPTMNIWEHPNVKLAVGDIAKARNQIKAQEAALNGDLAIAGGSTAGALGLGALYTALANKPEAVKQQDKIKDSLALQEMQSDTGDEDQLLGKTSALTPEARKAIGAAIATPVLAVPGWMAYNKLRKNKRKGKTRQLVEDIKALRNKYDTAFKDSIVDDMNIDPKDLKRTAADIAKTSAVNPISLGLGLAGIGAGVYTFDKARRVSDANSPEVKKMKKYREMLDRVSRLRNTPVVLKGTGIAPAEFVAIEKLRRGAPSSKKKVVKSKADNIKDTKGGTEPATVSASSDDPALQELLGSV